MEGDRFGRNFERSKNVQQTIGICPQALIRDFKRTLNDKNLEISQTMPQNIQKIAYFFPM